MTLVEVVQRVSNGAGCKDARGDAPIGFIVNKAGVVHRDDCRQVPILGPRVPVTSTQALVYHLPHCSNCWPVEADYRAAVGPIYARTLA